jgi:D-threo-aldose 1-dehydrogenase
MPSALPACPRRHWGSTGLSIPVIPFGTQGFGDNFGPVTREEAFALIRRAVDLGVNHFDCARCYGNSLAKLAAAVREGVVRRDEIIVSGRVCCHSAAKWGGYGEGRPDYSAARAVADVEDQLEFLGIGHFDAVFIHDPGEMEPTLVSGGCLEGLETAKARGLVHHLGYGMRPHDFHLAAIRSGRVDVLLCFGDYNLLRSTAADVLLPAAAAAGLGVLNGWSIMRGMLTGRPVEEIVARDRWLPGDDAARASALRSWCQERGYDLLALALGYCLRERRIHGNPLGNLNIPQLEANVRAVHAVPPESVYAELAAAGI